MQRVQAVTGVAASREVAMTTAVMERRQARADLATMGAMKDVLARGRGCGCEADRACKLE
jgi:hypothetical protein